MSIQLFDLTYNVARELGEAREGTATGGTTTTIVDTVNRVEDDDYFNLGTAWLLRDAAGAGAAPEGEYSRVSDFVKSSGTITVSPAFTIAPASGDKYAVAKARYPLWLLTQKVNQAAVDLGPVPFIDTSLTTASNQTEYTLPAAANLELRQVHIQTNVDDDDNRYVPLTGWTVERSTASGDATLVLAEQPWAARKLKLIYLALHDEMHAASDPLNVSVHPDLITYRAAYLCLRWYSDKTRTRDFAETMNHLLARAEIALIQRPIGTPRRQAKLARIGSTWVSYPGDRNPR